MQADRNRLRVGIAGSGNIGTDLMLKIERSEALELAGVAGIDPASDGLARAADRGHYTTAGGLATMLEAVDGIELVFDATSARAHGEHARLLSERGIRSVDLTPAGTAQLQSSSTALSPEQLELPRRALLPVTLVRTFPVEGADLVEVQTHERVAVTKAVIEERERPILSQSDQPNGQLRHFYCHRVSIDSVETRVRHQSPSKDLPIRFLKWHGSRSTARKWNRIRRPAALAGPQPVFDRAGVAVAEEVAAFDLQSAQPVLGMQQARPQGGVLLQLFGGVTQDLLDLGADVAPAAVLAELGGVDDDRQPLDQASVVLAAGGDLIEEFVDLVVGPVAFAAVAHPPHYRPCRRHA